ncbi:MAG TPA: 3'-5' exonuclease [Thermomicrobiales bacterium]|nr:3'-5' exonuclease [Thermomicrobiales bacterium]
MGIDHTNIWLAGPRVTYRWADPRTASILWARKMASNVETVYLDTETTGISDSAEIVEVAVVDGTGATVLHTLVKARHPIPAAAMAIHGISDDDVAGAPTWEDVHGSLCDVLEGRVVVVYNAEFDARMISMCGERHALAAPTAAWHCAMHAYAAFLGLPGRRPGDYRLHKLDAAVASFGGEPGGHRALGDALACRFVVLGMAATPSPEPEA